MSSVQRVLHSMWTHSSLHRFTTVVEKRMIMRANKYIQPLDQMERISRTALGKQLDEILDRVDKENVGFVISDEGKKDLVLCPAYWFTFAFDEDFGCIVNSALRYSIGRHTYMPSVVMDFVRKYLAVMDTRTVSVMIEDIEREIADERLDYREEWISLQNELRARYKIMLNKDAGVDMAVEKKNSKKRDDFQCK